MERQFSAIESLCMFWLIVAWIYLIFGLLALIAIGIVCIGTACFFVGLDFAIWLSNKR